MSDLPRRWRSSRWCRLGRDFFIDTEVLFDGGDTLQRMIDFFLETDDVLDFFSEVVEIATDRFEFRANGSKLVAHDGTHVGFGRHRLSEAGDLTSDIGNVFLGRHVLDDVREHLAEFFESRLLSRHMRKYSTPVGRHRVRRGARGCQPLNMQKCAGAASNGFETEAPRDAGVRFASWWGAGERGWATDAALVMRVGLVR